MNSKGGLSIFVAMLLLFSVLAVYGINLNPVYASTGHPELGAVNPDIFYNNATTSNVVVSSQSVSIKAGADMVNEVDGNSTWSGYYFAIIFKIGSTNLVTFSGSQFDLFISKDGYSAISSSDIKYASGFSVSALSASGLKEVTIDNPYLKNGEADFWIGTITDNSTGVTYAVLIGPIPYRISADYKYIKIFDGSTTAVAVSAQYLVILPTISLTPDFGPGGAKVTLSGVALKANSLINITYTSPSSIAGLIAQVTTSDTGTFEYSWNIADLETDWTGTGTIPNTPINIQVIYNNTGTLVDTVSYSEYSRAFVQVESLKKGATPLPFTNIYTGAGNGTITLDVYIHDEVVLAGCFFNPTGSITVKMNNTVLATATPNATGFFNLTFTVPITTMGSHEIDVWNKDTYLVLYINVFPTLELIPSEGVVGTTVTANAYGFPPNENIYIYWFELSYGDATYYNIVNGTTGPNGEFNVSVVFTAPHTYGGNHLVAAEDHWDGESTSSITSLIASVNFTVLPNIEVSPSEFKNDGSEVKIIGTGLDPSAAYVVNIDNHELAVSNDGTYPQAVFSNDTGDLVITFIAAGFVPGKHVVSLYPEKYTSPYTPMYALFTVTGVMSGTQQVLSAINSSTNTLSSKLDTLSSKLDDISSAISDLKSSVLSAISDVSSKIDSLSSAVNSISSTLSGLADEISSKVISSLSSKLNDISSAISSGFSDLKSSVSSLSSSVSSLKSDISSIKSDVSSVKSSVSNISDLITKSSSDTVSFLIAALVLIVITLIFAAAAAFKVFKG